MADRAGEQSERFETGRKALFQLSQRQVISCSAAERFVVARISASPLLEDEVRFFQLSCDENEVFRGDPVPLALADAVSERVRFLEAINGCTSLREIAVRGSEQEVRHCELWIDLDRAFEEDYRGRIPSFEECLFS